LQCAALDLGFLFLSRLGVDAEDLVNSVRATAEQSRGQHDIDHIEVPLPFTEVIGGRADMAARARIPASATRAPTATE